MAKKKNGGMIKQEAVRQALAELGKDAMPTQIKGHVKERFGIAMTTAHISNAKSFVLRKAGRKGKSLAKKPASGKPQVAQPSSAAPTKRAGNPLEDILTVKNLVGRLGAEPLRTLIDVFAK
jgi:hypothetical protein